VSASGAIHQIDAREDAVDLLSIFAGVNAVSYQISSSVTSRLYTMGTIDRKKFSSFEIHTESSSSESSNATIGINVENPDYSSDLTTISDLMSGNLSASEDASLRGRIGNKRGYGAQIVFTPTNGRPKLRAVKLNATVTNPSVVSAS
jgi:hypothetical protein